MFINKKTNDKVRPSREWPSLQISIVTLLWGVVLLSGCGEKSSETVKPAMRNITESVYASVKIVPDVSYYAQSVVSGIVEEVHVKEGSSVAKGDIIFTVKAQAALNRLTDARLTLEQSKANYKGQNSLLQNLKIEIDNARQRYSLDSLQYKKLSDLWKKNIGTKNDVDNAQLRYETSRNNLALLKKKYIQTETELENSYEKALNRLRNEEINLNDFAVESLIDGVVYEISKEPGEWVSTQDRMAEIGSKNQFRIEMEVDEMDIADVGVGDTAYVILDAYPHQVFSAQITHILPKKDIQNLTYKVEGIFMESPEKLLYGLSGEANIVVNKRDNALTIPTEYLKSERTVLTRKGEVPVVTGVKNMEFVEILSGIDSSTQLIKPE